MRLAWLLGLAVACAGASSLFARDAGATECHPANGLSPCIDADNLWPHAGGGPFFAIGSTTTTPRGQIAFGLVGSWLSDPIGLGVATPDPRGSTVFAVDKVLDATVLFALGVTDRLELTLAVPAALYQDGVGLSGVTGTGPAPSKSAVRDLRFGFALAILARPRSGVAALRGPGLTARFEVAAPVGTKSAFAGAATAVAAPSLVFDYRVGRVDVAAEAFARVRGEAVLADAVVGTQLGGALGATVDVIQDRWLTVGAEAFVLPTLAAQLRDPHDPTASPPPLVPAEWIASVSTAHLLGGAVVLSVGGGGSIPTGPRAALTSPRYRLDFGVRYAPTDPDSTPGRSAPAAASRGSEGESDPR